MKSFTGDYSSSPRPLSPSARIKAAFILGSLSAFGPLSLDMYLPALPKLAEELSTTASITQLSLTSCLLGLALGQLAAGPISDVRGRRTPLIISLCLYALSSLLCVFAPTVWVLIALRFLQGLSGAAGIVISRAVVRDLYSGSELTKFFSLLMLVNGAAPILAPIFGGQLLQFTSWRGVFVVLSLIGVVMMIAVLFGLPESLPKERRQSGGLTATWATFRRLLGNRLFIGFCLTQGLVSSAMFAYISGSSFVMQNVYNVSPQMYSLIFATNGVGIIIASQTTGRLAGRIKEAKMLQFGLALALTGSLGLLTAILLGGKLITVLIPLFFVVSCVGIISTSSFSLAMQSQGKAAGSASALLGLVPYILGATVAPLVGLGGEHTAVPMGIVIAIAEVGALSSYLLLINPRLKEQQMSLQE